MAASPQASPGAPAPVRLLLLLMLPLMAGWFYLDGQIYEADLLAFKPADQASAWSQIIPPRLGQMARAGQIRRFTKETLYEYINGHAEFFIGAGFRELAVAEFGQTATGDPALVANLYHMGKPLNAFGTLVNEAGDRPSADVGSLGFAMGQGVNFIQGPYYVQLSLFDQDIDPLPAARQLADGLAAGMQDSELSFQFPDFGQVIRTGFVREYYRGMEFFNRVLERSFQQGEGQLKAFITTGDAAEASASLQALQQFLDEEGIPFTTRRDKGLEFTLVSDPYEGDWFLVPLAGRLLGVFARLDEQLITQVQTFSARLEAK
jgi:hypothetical protein